MAMTKRLRVSFDIKQVISTKDVDAFSKQLISYSKRFLAGDKSLTLLETELARAACEGGVEHAIELMMKASVPKFIKDEMGRCSDSPHCSNFRVEVKQ